MHGESTEPKAMLPMLAISWVLAAVVIVTGIFGVLNIIDPLWMLLAMVLCFPPAFVVMLVADKVGA
jgi:hypothetical protein